MSRKKNRKLNTIFFIILIIISGYLYFKFSPSYSNKKSSNSIDAHNQNNFSEGLKIEKQTLTDRPAWYKEIRAEYPIGNIAGVQDVANFVHKEVEQLWCANDDDKLSADYAKQKGVLDLYQCSLDIKYSYSYNSKLISHKVSEYGTYGGTHGIYTAETFTYNKEGNLLSIADLVNDKNNYKKIISQKLKTKFQKIAKQNPDYNLDSIINEITDESKIDSLPFMVNEEGINFLFSEMNGLDYGMGEIEVLIGFSDMDGLVKKDFLD